MTDEASIVTDSELEPYSIAQLSVQAQRELLQLDAELDGLNVQDVYEFARTNPGSALHSMLDWDNASAGDKWRVQQVRHIIRSYRIEYKPADAAPRSVRGFISVREKDTMERRYRRVTDVMSDADSRLQVLSDLKNDLRRLEQKYAHLTEFSELLLETADRIRNGGH